MHDARCTTSIVILTMHSQAYAVSMVLMEKEACRFAQEHIIDLVTVCPVATVGKAPAARKIPASVPACLSLLSGM
jgi:anthocyanidin reductase